MRTANYVTNRIRVISSLATGTAVGALLIVFWYIWGATQQFGVQYVLDYGWFTALYVFIAAFVVWAIGLTIFALPLWWLFHRIQLRHWLIAAAIGAAMTLFVGFAIETRFFELIPPPSKGTYYAGDSGGLTIINHRRTPHGWWVAFRDALMLDFGGSLVALVIWRIAYRRNDDLPSQ